MIYINIFIPIYTYNKDIHRYNLTEKIFKHYKNIQEYFKENIIFKFVILGSELELSKELTLKYFKTDEYYEFDQNNSIYNNDMTEMFNNKIKMGIIYGLNKLPCDIFLVAGSNDYICYDFFNQIVAYYDPTKPQIYGIDNFNNGGNAVYFCHYNGKNEICNKEKTITKITKNGNLGYWWNGISDYHGREKYNYCGGILGGNFKYALTYPEFIENVVYDEGKMEKMFLDKPFVDKFNSKELFYMNIKVPNNKDMTCYNKLLKYNEDNIIQFENLNEKIRQKFESEFNMFINL